jgi:hypothetical protein
MLSLVCKMESLNINRAAAWDAGKFQIRSGNTNATCNLFAELLSPARQIDESLRITNRMVQSHYC